MFIGLYMAINNIITNLEVSKAILRDVKKKLQELTAGPLLQEIKMIKMQSTLPMIQEIEEERIKDFLAHKGTVILADSVSKGIYFTP